MRAIWLAGAIVAGCTPTFHGYGTALGELHRAAPARDVELTGPTLDRADLVQVALARNPDLESARQGWRAALAEVPAATALDDPMLTYEVAPLSIASDAPFGQRVSLSQRLPYPGKRRLAGAVALADADAMRADYQAMRLEIAEMASNLYDDAYLLARELEVNAHHRDALTQLRQAVEAQYTIGRGGPEDSLAIQVELGRLEHDRVMLERAQAVTTEQIDALLHRDPDAPVPPPPAELGLPDAPGKLADLEREALGARPEDDAARARARGGGASVALAERERYPDLDLMASYDSMWDMPQHRWMIGVSIDVPLARGRRHAETEAATARRDQASAQVEQVDDRIQLEVATARHDLAAALHQVELYDQELLPTAKDESDAAIAAFTSGGSLATAIRAEKDLRDVELEALVARTDAWRTRAALDRALGRLP